MDVYHAPEADLERSKAQLSAKEKLAQSRRDIEEVAAVTRLNVIWGIRLVIDVLIVLLFIIVFAAAVSDPGDGLFLQGLTAFIVVICIPLSEIFFIIAYYRRKPWCVIPLHIYAAISLLNIPVGTILSIIHYLNMHKVQFEK